MMKKESTNFESSAGNTATIESVWVLNLYGFATETFTDIDEAIAYVVGSSDQIPLHSEPAGLLRIEVQVRLAGGGKIHGEFRSKETAREFLENKKKGLL